ncbi:MAG TPA: methionyl-tRNA formyltransferase [Nocardioidaceae bacterium]|nr:methionyl-tRNA formyltransferase [Nocardioidaceae bacterium]
MRLLFAGTPESAVPSLRALLASRHDVVAVLSRPDAPSGRGRRLTPSPVAALSREAGIEVLTPPTPRDPVFLDRLRAIAPDGCAVVAYGGLIPPDALAVPVHGWVNLHFSVLPAWRGAAPVQRAIMAGDDITGATTFRLVEELDAGPTYGVMTATVRPDDTAGTLLERLALDGAGLLVTTFDGLEDGIVEARPQSTDAVSYAPKLTVEESRVSWSRIARAVDAHIRGCTPAPGAWTTALGARLKVGPVRPLDDEPPLGPGDVRTTKSAVMVGTGSVPVALSTVQAQGKPWMAAADWARGLRGELGRLGD